MKIALVILRRDPTRGGAERYTVDLARGLRGRGHEAALISSEIAPKLSELSPSPDEVLLPVGRGSRLAKYLRFLDALDAHLAQCSYDIVHAMLPVRQCDLYHPHAGIAAEAVSRGHLKHSGRIKRTAALLANRTNLKRRRFASVERELLTGPNPPIVLSLSEYVKRDVVAHYPLAADRLATLFNAVDLAKFDPAARAEAGRRVRERWKIPPRQVVALMIAQDYERKGLRQAILAVAKTADPSLVLLVVGKQDSGVYQSLAQSQGLERQVIFAGSTEDPYAYYQAADLFVLPTRHDPCSLVVLEALAMGLPVISTVFNGACEIMTPGRHGFVLNDPADTNALADSFRQLLDPAARQEMSTACLALRPRLSYERHLDQLLNVYESRREMRSS